MSDELQWRAVAFTATNTGRALFYVPHVNGLGTAYTGVVLGDTVMALSFAASVAGCGAMVVLTALKRYQHGRTEARAAPRVSAPLAPAHR